MTLSVSELKFLLRLLEVPGYRRPICEIRINDKISAASYHGICRTLAERGLVAYTLDIQRYRTTTAGKILLDLDMGVRPVTPDEHRLLKAARHQAILPSQVQRVPATIRQRLLPELAARNLITIGKSAIAEVWLSEQGKYFLRHEYLPDSSGSLPLTQLGSYLQFLRQPVADPASQPAREPAPANLSC